MARHVHRLEEHVVAAARQRDAALRSEMAGDDHDAVRQRDADFLLLAIDHRLADFLPLLVWTGEVADAFRRDVRIEPGDEHRRAHRLGVAGGVVLERIAGRRLVRRVELELPGAREQRCVRRRRRLWRNRRCGGGRLRGADARIGGGAGQCQRGGDGRGERDRPPHEMVGFHPGSGRLPVHGRAPRRRG